MGAKCKLLFFSAAILLSLAGPASAADPHSISMIRSPTVGRFLAARLFAGFFVLVRVFIPASYSCKAYPSTKIGVSFFMAFLSALLKLALSFFA